MANRYNANDDFRRRLAVDAPPPSISKDMQGSENPIPLSPQWLLPKPVDNKLGISSGDLHSSLHHGNCPDAISASGIGEDSHDAGKRKDVFRPSSYELDSGRRDRWRDEERESHSATRRDRWREGEKELGDARRTERWSDNSARHMEEACRAPAERWTDSSNRDNTYDQRRESKWNTRWGPDDKDSENRREKWSDSSRGYEGSRERGTSQLPIHEKDPTSQGKDMDGEHSRSWRSNSFLARGWGESNLPQPLIPNKQALPFGHGRGKGENGASVFSASRGKVDSSPSIANNGSSRSALGFASERSDGTHGNQFPLKYSRMKLLDIYRMTDLKSFKISLEGFVDATCLTIAEPVEPLALSAPTSEELATLKGIDKGDIVSSGLPQVSKEGSTGKSSGDLGVSRQPRLESREETTFAFCDYKEEINDNIKGDHSSYLESPSHAKYLHPHGLDLKVASSRLYQENKLTSEGEMGAKEVRNLERSSSRHTTPWRSQSVGECSDGSSLDWHDYSAEARTRISDMDQLHFQHNLETEQKNSTAVSSSYFRDKSLHQKNDIHSEQRNDLKIQRQSSEIVDLGREDALFQSQEDPYSRNRPAGKLPPSLSPEDLSLCYKDPQGQIQGPFTGSDLIGWFEAGYFGIDLQVRIASAPAEAPFSLLGDVMPHLRAKARPPPGFGTIKPNDVAEVSNTGKFGSLGNAHSAVDEFDAIKSMQRNRHEVATEEENRFIESLMSGNMSSSSSEHYSYVEGVKGYSQSSMRVENMRDTNYLLAQRISLERHRSLSTAGPYWSGQDASSVGTKPDMVPESPSPHPNFLPNVAEASCQIPQSPQQVDFLAMLQTAADKSPSPAVNSAPIWQNVTEVSSLNNLTHGVRDIVKDKVDMLHNQNITSQTGFGAQHQRLLPQSQPSLPHLLGQSADLPSGVASPEKLIATEISQDPQLLGLLQQQYLMSQIQLYSQSFFPSHLSVIDEYLLLKQQKQQQQEQQQQQLLLHQQQQLLSQVLSGSQSLQPLGDLSFGHLKASVPAGNTSMAHLGIRQMHETLLNNQQMPVLSSLDGCLSNVSNFNVQGAKDVSCNVRTEPSPPHLPHQMFDHSSQPEGWDTNPLSEVGSLPNSDLESAFKAVDSFLSAEHTEKNAKGVFPEQTNLPDKLPAVSQTKENMDSVAAGAMNGVVSKDAGISNVVSSLSEKLNDVNISSENVPEKCHDDVPPVKEVKEGKKTSEKKSRKKNSKPQQVSEHGKGSSKTNSNLRGKPDSETEGANIGGRTTGLQMETEESLHKFSALETGLGNSVAYAASSLDTKHADLSSSAKMITNEVGFEGKAEVEEVEIPSINSQTSSIWAWKPAPGLKPKSLLEIQQEEQRRLQAAPMVLEPSAATVHPTSSGTPWAGVVANSEQQVGTDIVQNPNSVQGALGNSENSSVASQSRKSQLHDLLAEEVLAKSKEDSDIPDEKGSPLTPFPKVGVQVEIQSVDDDFVEARDTKKSRKKAAKAAKAAGLKVSPPVVSGYLSASSVSVEKSKSTRQTQQEKEILPVPPSGPSLGDFVLWKGDQTSSSPAPAWSTVSTKLQKPTSLRDILREQEKKGPVVQQHIPIPTLPKVQSNRGRHGSDSSWPVPGSSPSKVASPSQTKAASPVRTILVTSNQSRPKAEDDLFWGPLDQSKQETKQSDFPSLANPNSLGGKAPSGRGVPGGSSTRQKPAGVGLPSSAADQSSSKGKRDAVSKHSEAMDFRCWCENELAKLTGMSDTSFLEFCLKQSTSEAEMLLRENLGSLDRNHEFIDKFLNYKDFLAPDVVEMAFGAIQSSPKVGEDTLPSKDTRALRDVDAEGGGKKKGKRGKKVSPAVLGFHVVSNRIMVGEIQNIED